METVPRRLTFGAHAAEYERTRPAWPEEAARWLVPEEPQLVVELGAGTGKLTRAVAALGVRVVAVEPDLRMLALLREAGLEGIDGSAEAIPFEDGVADAVVAGSSLHWFELAPALREIHRVLAPGGRFAFGWNHRDDRHPTIARMGQAIHAAQGRSEVPSWRMRDWRREVTREGLFRDVEHALFPHTHELLRSALDHLLIAYSGVAALGEEGRRLVFAQVGQILDGDPSLREGDTLRLPYVVTAFRAVRD